jgi:hypothetical protein
MSQEHVEKVLRVLAAPPDACAIQCWIPVFGDGIAGEKREKEESQSPQ